MFIYRFSGKFFSNFKVISKIFWCSDFLYQIFKRNYYLIPYFINVSLMTLIFICVGCVAQPLKINRKYTTIKRWLETMGIPHKKISGDVLLVFLNAF